MVASYSKKRLSLMGPLMGPLMGLCLGVVGVGVPYFFSGADMKRAEAADYEGQLIIYNKKSNDGTYPDINCTLPFVNSTIDFQNNSAGCVNDDAYAFKLENVPSATFFTFTDSPNCSEAGGFYYRFKTIKHPTSMEVPMNIEEAGKKAIGSVVTPGVLLIASITTGQVGGKLSCVKIERSAVPSP